MYAASALGLHHTITHGDSLCWLATLPLLQQTAQQLAFNLPAHETATSYQVRITHDASLTEVIHSGVFAFTTSATQFSAPPEGPYSMDVRAVNKQGILGLEARRPVRIDTLPPSPNDQPSAPAQQSSARATALRSMGVAHRQTNTHSFVKATAVTAVLATDHVPAGRD
jgi:hypothetical protein